MIQLEHQVYTLLLALVVLDMAPAKTRIAAAFRFPAAVTEALATDASALSSPSNKVPPLECPTRPGFETENFSALAIISFIIVMVSTGYFPFAVSPEVITASAPS